MEVVRKVLTYSSQHDFAGYNKHDALNSPLMKMLFGWAKLPRLVAIQSVMRVPLNVRPLLMVPKTRNPKGIGLFASAYLYLYQTEGRPEDLAEAVRLLDWLLAQPSRGFRGLSWGYPYPWQDIGFYAPRDLPNRVVTCWIGFAFVQAAAMTGDNRYRECLPKIIDFLTGEPKVLYDTQNMKCYSYVPDESVTWAVMDVPALAGASLAEVGHLLDNREYIAESKKLLNWVVDKQTDYGAWYYTHPPTDSHITHDNYHTAIILDCIDRYTQAASDDIFIEAYRKGLEYYRCNLFNDDGSPRWTDRRDYPHDIHGAASGILCFLRAARYDPAFKVDADRILRWTLDHMYNEDGFFSYQQHVLWTKKFCLMRWCNAWMALALAKWLGAQ
jgi:hypothetical protein